MGLGGGAASPQNFSNSHFRAQKRVIIWAKPLDFRASNGKKLYGQETSAPPPPRTKLLPYAYGYILAIYGSNGSAFVKVGMEGCEIILGREVYSIPLQFG